MTDEQIIQALEICVSEEIRCSECPFDEVCGNFEIKDLLDLINRQKVEIEKLNTVNADMHESLRLACETNKDLQAEIERLAEENKSFADIGKMYSEIKAEAIKEMNAKIYCYKTNIFIKGEELIIIPMSDYNDILKEMVGDTE